MYAVIEACGKQYKVQDGDVLFMEKLGAEVGETVRFDKVVFLSDNDEEKLQTPSGSQTALHKSPDQKDRSLTNLLITLDAI